MTRIAGLQRSTAVAALLLAIPLLAVFVLFSPDLDDPAGPLAAIAAAGALGQASAWAFVVAQLPWTVGLLGVAHVLRQRFRVLGPTISTLVLIGGFGHMVPAGWALVQIAMAEDLDGAARYETVMEHTYASAVPLFAVTMVGVVIGQLLLGVALLRGGLGPRWLGGLLIVWLVVEFVGTGITPRAGYLSAPLMAGTFGLLAYHLSRSDIRLWMTAAEADALADAEEATGAAASPVPA
jgi:hypothetical protein